MKGGEGRWGKVHKQTGGMKEKCSGTTRWFVTRGQGRGGPSVEDKGWSDSRGALNAMPSSPDFGWAPPKGCKGGRPRPSSESEDISGSSVEDGPEGRPDNRLRTKVGLTVTVQVREAQGLSQGRIAELERVHRAAQKVKLVGLSDQTRGRGQGSSDRGGLL